MSDEETKLQTRLENLAEARVKLRVALSALENTDIHQYHVSAVRAAWLAVSTEMAGVLAKLEELDKAKGKVT